MYDVLDVSDENLHVHTTDDSVDIDDLNVQKENLHVHSINNIDNLNVHNNCSHVHDEYHHNFTCSVYKLPGSCAKEIQPPRPAS